MDIGGVVGLTGPPAVGKGKTIAYLTEICGDNGVSVGVVKADDVGKYIVCEDVDTRKKLVSRFGRDYLVDGELDFELLRPHVFSGDRVAKKDFDAITIPATAAEIVRRISKSKLENNLTLFESAIAVENGGSYLTDNNWIVMNADLRVRLDRFRNSPDRTEKMDEDEFLRRTSSQMNIEDQIVMIKDACGESGEGRFFEFDTSSNPGKFVHEWLLYGPISRYFGF